MDVPERMTEAHKLELVAHGGSDLLALHAVALKRGFGEARAEDEKAVAHVLESPYSSSGFMFRAWLAGIVQGVVVQMTLKQGFSRLRPKISSTRARVLVGELEGDVDRVALLVLVLDFGFGQGRTGSRSTSSRA